MTSAPIRQPHGHEFSRILAVAGVRGERVVPNEEIAGPIDSSDEWIQSHSGIKTRVYAREDQSVLDLATQAAEKVLAKASMTGADLDAIILSTVTYWRNTPSGACTLADRIGANGAAAYDISAACAGYCYAIGQADALVRSGNAEHVLVIGAEKLSDFIDPTDRSISWILGDGAGAAIVGPSDFPGIGPTVWGADGANSDKIYQTHSWDEFRGGAGVEWPTLRQEGPSVFRWASFQMAHVAQEAIDKAGVSAQDLEVFIPHQANMRIIDQLMKQCHLPENIVVARDIAETGNTSAASIPLATAKLLDEGKAHSGQLALQIGFGAGLVYAAQVISLP